jgi:hypothetical protein
MGNSPSTGKSKWSSPDNQDASSRSRENRVSRRRSALPSATPRQHALLPQSRGTRRRASVLGAVGVRQEEAPPPPYSEVPTRDRHEPMRQYSIQPSSSIFTGNNRQVAPATSSRNPFRAGPTALDVRRDSELPSRPNDTVPAPPGGSTSSQSRSQRRMTYRNEDALQTLKKYDTVIIVDDSSSMAGDHWTEVSFRSTMQTGILNCIGLLDKDGACASR